MLRLAFKALHIVAELGKIRTEGRLIAFRTVRVRIKGTALPHFKLAAPEPAVVHISAAVIVHKNSRVNAAASGNVILFRGERPRGVVRNRDAQAENPVMIPCREIQVVFSVLEGRVRRPHLFAYPGDILHVQGASMIHTVRLRTVHG